MIQFPILLGISLIGLGTALIGKALKNEGQGSKHDLSSGSNRSNHKQGATNSSVDGSADLTPQLDGKRKRKSKNVRMEPEKVGCGDRISDGDGGGSEQHTATLNRSVEAVAQNDETKVPQGSLNETPVKSGQDDKRALEKGLPADKKGRGKSAQKEVKENE